MLLAELQEVSGQAIEIPGWILSLGAAVLGAILTWLFNRVVKDLDKRTAELVRKVESLQTDHQDLRNEVTEIRAGMEARDVE